MTVLAAEYPLLEVFWTIMIFFVWVAWIFTVVYVLSDVFRRRDLNGGAKAAWTLFVIILPFLGVLTYLVMHSNDMAERSIQTSLDRMDRYDERARTSGGTATNGAASEIATAQQLRDAGTITGAEFESLKARALA